MSQVIPPAPPGQAIASIPAFAVTFTPAERAQLLADVAAILDAGRLVLGPFTERFEQQVARLAGRRYAVATSSGTSALEIILRALDVAGRRVLVPANTNVATASAALAAGGQVELYDAGLYPDRDDLARRLEATRPPVAAVVVVHIGGYLAGDLPALAADLAARQIPLVEDAAHAHGATLAGQPAGSFGQAAAFSFFATKVVTTGEGGALVTDDPDLAALARRYRDQGKQPDGLHHDLLGSSWRLTELGAALGCAQLARFAHDHAHRARLLALYAETLPAVSDPRTHPADHRGLRLIQPAPNSQPSGYKAIAQLADGVDRASYRARLAAYGMQLAREVYQIPLHRQPVFAELAAGQRFPVADRFCARHVCLPLWRGLSPAAVRTAAELAVRCAT